MSHPFGNAIFGLCTSVLMTLIMVGSQWMKGSYDPTIRLHWREDLWSYIWTSGLLSLLAGAGVFLAGTYLHA